MAVDGRGNAITVWSRFNSTNFIVQAAVRAAGGAFGAPQDLSAAGRDAGFPQVAVDGRGDAIAVWSRFDGTNFITQAAARVAARAAAGATSPLNGVAAERAGTLRRRPGRAQPRRWRRRAGRRDRVWRRFDAGTNAVVQAAARVAASRHRRRFTPKRGGSFGAPQDLSTAGQSASFSEVR